MLSRIFSSIGRHFKRSVDTIICSQTLDLWFQASPEAWLEGPGAQHSREQRLRQGTLQWRSGVWPFRARWWPPVQVVVTSHNVRYDHSLLVATHCTLCIMTMLDQWWPVVETINHVHYQWVWPTGATMVNAVQVIEVINIFQTSITIPISTHCTILSTVCMVN